MVCGPNTHAILGVASGCITMSRSTADRVFRCFLCLMLQCGSTEDTARSVVNERTFHRQLRCLENALALWGIQMDLARQPAKRNLYA